MVRAFCAVFYRGGVNFKLWANKSLPWGPCLCWGGCFIRRKLTFISVSLELFFRRTQAFSSLTLSYTYSTLTYRLYICYRVFRGKNISTCSTPLPWKKLQGVVFQAKQQGLS